MKLIDRRKRKSGKGAALEAEDGGGPKDLLGLMIRASAQSNAISVNDIVEECKGFFFAGKHSTSNLLTWTAVLLAMHPRWQEAAREEVFRVCGTRHLPSKDDVVKLKTVRNVPTYLISIHSTFTISMIIHVPENIAH